MSRFDPRRQVMAVTMVWQRQDGDWERYLIREQRNNSPHLEKLISVKTHVPVCMACLSNDVVVVESTKYPDGELICHECGVRYGFLM
jgi:hypothetical protein